MKDTKNNYQLVVVFDPKTEEKDKEKINKKIEDILAENKAEIVKKDKVGLKSLAYKIKTFDKGDFWIWDLAAAKPFNVKEFNLFLNREPSIIRYLVLKK
jgi:ribosomal protein S6